MKLLYWLITVPMWLFGAVYLFSAAFTFNGAERYAAKNAKLKVALEQRARYVEDYRQRHGKLPDRQEFEAASKSLDHDFHQFWLFTIKPSPKEGFHFPAWPDGEENYAIAFWRGEWSEFYDSATRKTSLDESVSAVFWRRQAAIPFVYSLGLFLAPIAAWHFLQRATVKKFARSRA